MLFIDICASATAFGMSFGPTMSIVNAIRAGNQRGKRHGLSCRDDDEHPESRDVEDLGHTQCRITHRKKSSRNDKDLPLGHPVGEHATDRGHHQRHAAKSERHQPKRSVRSAEFLRQRTPRHDAAKDRQVVEERAEPDDAKRGNPEQDASVGVRVSA